MNSYIRDDGVEMIETRPGCFTRRDALGLLDLAPLTRRVNVLAQDDGLVRRAMDRVTADVTGPGFVPPPLAPSHDDLAPEPVEPPPLQPSHEDLVSAAPAPKPPRAPRPKPAKRSLAAILAEAERTHRTRKAKA